MTELQKNFIEKNILPNNIFKYSVAFCGVFAIDERPNRKIWIIELIYTKKKKKSKKTLF